MLRFCLKSHNLAISCLLPDPVIVQLCGWQILLHGPEGGEGSLRENINRVFIIALPFSRNTPLTKWKCWTGWQRVILFFNTSEPEILYWIEDVVDPTKEGERGPWIHFVNRESSILFWVFRTNNFVVDIGHHYFPWNLLNSIIMNHVSWVQTTLCWSLT
jgi:hypothetical protein